MKKGGAAFDAAGRLARTKEEQDRKRRSRRQLAWFLVAACFMLLFFGAGAGLITYRMAQSTGYDVAAHFVQYIESEEGQALPFRLLDQAYRQILPHLKNFTLFLQNAGG